MPLGEHLEGLARLQTDNALLAHGLFRIRDGCNRGLLLISRRLADGADTVAQTADHGKNLLLRHGPHRGLRLNDVQRFLQKIIHRTLLKGGYRSTLRMVQRVGDLNRALRNQNTEGTHGSKERTGKNIREILRRNIINFSRRHV